MESLNIWLKGLRMDADIKAVHRDRCVACERCSTVDQLNSSAFLV